MIKTLERWTSRLKLYAGRWWYAPFVGLLAGLDSFVIVFPTDALVISAAMLVPRRWISNAFVVAVGSSLGALALAYVLRTQGLPWIEHFSPEITHSKTWLAAEHLMASWGVWAVLFISITPTMQQPIVILAALAGVAPPYIFLASLVGRTIKYSLYGYVGTHAPVLLQRFWPTRAEVVEAAKITRQGEGE